MKKLFVTAAIVVSAVLSAHAQGTLVFASAGVGVNAKFYTDPAGPIGSNNITSSLSGGAFRADLWWAPGTTTVGVQNSDLVNQAGFNQIFSSVAAQAGYFTGGTKTLTGWSSGMIVAQVRVWDTAVGGGTFGGSDYQFASPMFTLTPTIPPTAPVNLVGLGNPAVYKVVYVPEPATFGLAGLGAAAMLILRRRK